MKRTLIFSLLVFLSTYCLGQTNEENKNRNDQRIEDAMEELQKALDTLDFSELFSSDMFEGIGGNLFGGMDIGNLDSLFLGQDGFNNLFGEGFEEMLGGENFEQLLGESMKMFEHFDAQDFEQMFEGMELDKLMEGFDMEAFEKMFEGIDMGEMPVTPGNKQNKEKDKKIKKI